ncbi:MAG TPA: potassium channel protein [bacterium]|nr:potassium channel protein [bacterium]
MIPRGTRYRILQLTALLVAVVAAGTAGYHFVLGWAWLDALYMTAITITTVGFEEVHHLDATGRLLTIVVLLTSAGVFAYTLTTLATIVLDARFGSLLWRRRMERKIEKLENHYVICGFGRTGRAVAEQLQRNTHPFVVIEHLPDKIELLQERDYLFVDGDATQDDCLHRARIDHAKGLVAALGNDAENVYLVLSARQIKPDLSIVSWATSQEAERKVLRAGANHALSPYLQGGRRIATLLTSPHALEFLDHAMGGSDNIRLGEIMVQPGSPLAGNSLKDAGLRRDLGVIVIGIRRANGKLEFNPSADATLHEQDILIGIGAPDQIEKLRHMV